MTPNGIIPVLKTGGDFVRLKRNPMLTSLDGERKASLETIASDSWTAQDRAAFGVYLVDVTPPEGQGWTGAFEEQDGEPVPVFEAKPPPQSVSMRQARLAMLNAGILSDVEAAIANAETAAQIEWEYATIVRRDHPLIAAIGSQLAMSEQDIDALFVAASQID